MERPPCANPASLAPSDAGSLSGSLACQPSAVDVCGRCWTVTQSGEPPVCCPSPSLPSASACSAAADSAAAAAAVALASARLLARSPWGVDGPPGATGVLSRGVPPVKGVWGAAPGSPPQAPIFSGFFD